MAKERKGKHPQSRQPSIARDEAAGTQPKSKQEKLEEELVEKLPDATGDAQEWGERISTGKAIATGGKSAEDEKRARQAEKKAASRRPKRKRR